MGSFFSFSFLRSLLPVLFSFLSSFCFFQHALPCLACLPSLPPLSLSLPLSLSPSPLPPSLLLSTFFHLFIPSCFITCSFCFFQQTFPPSLPSPLLPTFFHSFMLHYFFFCLLSLKKMFCFLHILFIFSWIVWYSPDTTEAIFALSAAMYLT